jgi:DNA-binding MarR family transcriptional regulator
MDVNEYLKLDNQLCFVLYAAYRETIRMYRPLLDELGLTYPQYLVMLVLWENDGMTVNGIGERLRLDSGTLTPMLKRLSQSGLVSRKRDSGDERRVRVHLTKKGIALKQKAVKVPESMFCRSGLSADQFFRMKNELLSLIRHMESESDGTC